MDILTPFLKQSVYGLKQARKQPLINQALNQLNRYHSQHCKAYQQLLANMNYTSDAKDYAQQPFVTTRLFKTETLKSIADSEVFKTLTSSGTSSDQLSRIYLDTRAARDQTRALAKIMQQFVGKQRLPMLLIDHADLIHDRQAYSARGAGVQGLSFLGREHCYALDSEMNIQRNQVTSFFNRFGDQKILVFGFTFMVWRYFLHPLQTDGIHFDLNNVLLFHSGGWKKLQQRAVSNTLFKQTCRQVLGQCAVHNFYGMVEQTGTVFVECEAGFLHTPVFSDIVIRDPLSLEILPPGQEGVIQLFSVLPTSYPGHSLLTEDIGRIEGEDDCACGRKGRYFRVIGRLSRAENRGCSDTMPDPIHTNPINGVNTI